VFRFIEAQKAVFHIATMCRVLGVTPQGYYAWRKRPPSPRALADAELTAAIKRIFEANESNYGAPRVHVELIACGWICGRKRVARLMRTAGLAGRDGRRRGPRTTRRVEPEPRLPDLEGVPPALVISTTKDPATPYEAGVALAEAMDGALLTYEGTQHTIFLQGNSCVDEAGIAYLIDGTLPEEDPRCASE
jgi:pimeloyl-ACP methyl ester carboxylesterase